MQNQGIKINLNKLYSFVYSLGVKYLDFVQSYDNLNGMDGILFLKNELSKTNVNVFSISNEIELDEVAMQLFHFYHNPNDFNNPLAYVVNELSKLN